MPKIFCDSMKSLFAPFYVDLLVGEARNEVMRRLGVLNPAVSLPTITVDRDVIAGFKEEKLRRALSLPPKEEG
jgi:hypothetical protein